MPDYEIVNLGVAGYGTAQELLLLEREFDFFEPDLVFLIVSGNDRNDNSSNKGYSAYRPYFSRDGDALRRAGVPVPIAPSYAHKSSWLYHRSALVRLVAEIRAERLHPPQSVRDPSEELIVAIHRFLAQRNAKLAIGLILPDAGLWSVCEREEIPCLDLSEIGPQHRFPSHGRHWTETGHRRVSYLVFDFLVERGLIRTGTGVAPR